jgi:hypothetical protein
MNYRILFLLFVLSLVLPTYLSAESLEAVPNPPEIPEPMRSGVPLTPLEAQSSLAPEVVITERKDTTVTEYRSNGKLYKVKIQPSVGPAYWYFDADGDGKLDFHSDEPYQSTTAQWEIFKW